jgi:hypothetical protein
MEKLACRQYMLWGSLTEQNHINIASCFLSESDRYILWALIYYLKAQQQPRFKRGNFTWGYNCCFDVMNYGNCVDRIDINNPQYSSCQLQLGSRTLPIYVILNFHQYKLANFHHYMHFFNSRENCKTPLVS